jgi:hypothetical protein
VADLLGRWLAGGSGGRRRSRYAALIAAPHEICVVIGFTIVLVHAGYYLIAASAAFIDAASASSPPAREVYAEGEVFPDIEGLAFAPSNAVVIAVISIHCRVL